MLIIKFHSIVYMWLTGDNKRYTTRCTTALGFTVHPVRVSLENFLKYTFPYPVLLILARLLFLSFSLSFTLFYSLSCSILLFLPILLLSSLFSSPVSLSPSSSPSPSPFLLQSTPLCCLTLKSIHSLRQQYE